MVPEHYVPLDQSRLGIFYERGLGQWVSADGVVVEGANMLLLWVGGGLALDQSS